MEQLTRHVIPAKVSAEERPERFHSGVVKHFRDAGPYTAEAAVWTGKQGSGRMIVSDHETEAEAITALFRVYARYPNAHEEAVVFFGGYDVLD